MPSKRKLKRQLKKQSIHHRMELSDKTVEVNSLRYSLNFSEQACTKLETENDKLKTTIDKLKEELQLQKLVGGFKVAIPDVNGQQELTFVGDRKNGILPSERTV